MAKGVRTIVTVEDNTVIGGLGAAVAAIYDGTVHMLGFADKPLRQASVSEQKHDAGIDGEGIAEKISEILGGKVG